MVRPIGSAALRAVDGFEDLQVEDDETHRLARLALHPLLLCVGELQFGHSGMIFHPGFPFSLYMNVVWIMRFIQAPASPISISDTNGSRPKSFG